MRIRSILPFCLMVLISYYCTFSMSLPQNRIKRMQNISSFSQLPKTAAQAMSLEFQGIIADYLMLNVLTFLGGKSLNEQTITDKEYKQVFQAFQSIISLDPRATDPWILAETVLPWEANMVHETNALLKHVIPFHKNNHRPYFYLWFNHHHFLKEPDNGVPYLQKAAKIPGAPVYYSLLASRMNFYFGQLEASIIFIQNMLKESHAQVANKPLERRLEALKKMHFLEKKIVEYKNEFGNTPRKLTDIIDAGLIKSIPSDPYGGTFFIREDGRVYSTSKLVMKKPKQ